VRNSKSRNHVAHRTFFWEPEGYPSFNSYNSSAQSAVVRAGSADLQADEVDGGDLGAVAGGEVGAL
jgi:hypothetical protein